MAAPEVGKWLSALTAAFGAISGNWDDASIEGACKKVAEEAGAKPAKVIHLARAAVSGRTVGPSLFGLLTALGKDRVLARIGRTQKQLAEGKMVAA